MKPQATPHLIRQALSVGTENQNPSSVKFAFGGAKIASLISYLFQRYLTRQTHFHDLVFDIKSRSKLPRLLCVLKRISD